eukprot:6186527-Pleurochrysis_carterae.AAC.4
MPAASAMLRQVQRTMLEIVNQLDGFEARGNVKILMATNRRVRARAPHRPRLTASRPSTPASLKLSFAFGSTARL